MSENELGSDFGDTAYDPEQRDEAELNLDDPMATDNEPWSPPDRQPRAGEFLDEDTSEEETIDQRILQEEPEEGTAYGAPDPRGEFAEGEPEMLGGDDPDAIPAEDDVLGSEDDLDPDAEAEEESELDEEFDTSSPEGSALHVTDDR